jgi:hypothetical protein
MALPAMRGGALTISGADDASDEDPRASGHPGRARVPVIPAHPNFGSKNRAACLPPVRSYFHSITARSMVFRVTGSVVIATSEARR